MPASVPPSSGDQTDGRRVQPASAAGERRGGTRALPAPAPSSPPAESGRDVGHDADHGAAPPRRGRGGGLATALLVLVGLALVATSGFMADLPPAYESTATVALEPRPDAEVPSAAMITLLAAPYVSYAASDSTLGAVSDVTDVPVDEVREGVTVTMEPESTNVEVSATFDDPTVATAVAAEVARRIEDFASADRSLVAEVVVPAAEAERTTTDRLRPVLVPGLLVLGLLLVVAGAARALLARRRGRVRAQQRDGVTA